MVTAYNRADFVSTCLTALKEAQHDGLRIDVIVMDNGSSDNTAEAAQSVGDLVRVLRTEDNRPIASVINRGLKIAYEDEETDYILLLNEDTLFTPGSIQRLLEACDAHPGSLSTPLQINYRKPDHLDDNAYKDVVQTRELVEDALFKRPFQQVYPLRTIIAAAMFGRRDVWRNVGEWDETFWFYGVDDDFCTRAKWLGYEILLVPESHLLHAHGKLGGEAKQSTWEPYPKWQKETQARYLFRLKKPDGALPLLYLTTAYYALTTSLTCLWALWPKGALGALTIYGHCLRKYRHIAETRRRHFDPARKIHA